MLLCVANSLAMRPLAAAHTMIVGDDGGKTHATSNDAEDTNVGFFAQ